MRRHLKMTPQKEVEKSRVSENMTLHEFCEEEREYFSKRDVQPENSNEGLLT